MSQKTESKVGILLLHGLTGVPSEMRPLEKYFQKCGFEVSVPMLAGHGGTHHELIAVKWQEWVDSARAALKDLLSRTDRVLVSGLSMGASLAAILAAEEPRVAGVIMLSATIDYDGSNLDNLHHQRKYKSRFWRQAARNACRLVPWVGSKLYWTETAPYGLKDPRLQKQITKSIEAAAKGESDEFGLFRTYFASLTQMYALTDHMVSVAGSVDCPVLLISSLEDTLASLRNPLETYAMFTRSSNRSVALLTGCDHVLPLDLKRNYVCRLMGEFAEATLGVAMPSSEANSQLTIEIHNRLNPLPGGNEWQRLTPEHRPLMDTVNLLQELGTHESDCHTFVVRYNNEPQMMLPLFNLFMNLNSTGSPLSALVRTVLAAIAPRLLACRMLTFGFGEGLWNADFGGGQQPLDAETKETTWKSCLDVVELLSTSLSDGTIGFVSDKKPQLSQAVFASASKNPLLAFIRSFFELAPVRRAKSKLQAEKKELVASR